MEISDVKNLEQLLENGKWDEAKEALDDLLKADLTDQEKGALLVNFGLIYTEVMGRINQRYLEALEEAEAVLKELNTKEKETVEGIELARVENTIKSL